MAKLLISFPAHIYDKGQYRLVVFYEGLLKALKENGNELFIINSAEYLARFWDGDNILKNEISKNKLISDVIDFDPELIIAFNHSIPSVVLENTTCRVAVWDADSIEFYNDKNYIKKHMDRYYFLAFSKAGVQNAINFGAKKDRVHQVHAATEVQAETIPVNTNISFIGSGFIASYEFILELYKKTPAKLKPLVEELNQNFYSDHMAIIRKHNCDGIEKKIPPKALASLSAVQNRISILNTLEPLGLSLYGNADWYNVGQYLPWLAMSYIPQKVYSLEHNQDIYNSSKIALNISHSQATTGFPWRIFDIMASNACLASDHKSELEELTKNYIDIPFYDNPVDAYNVCKKILSDEVWRSEIVLGSQLFIKENGRWVHRFKELSEIFGLDFISDKEQASYVLKLNNYIKPASDYYYWHSRLKKKIVFTIIKKSPKVFLRMVYKLLMFFRIKVPSQFITQAVDIKNTISVNSKS